MEIIDNLNTEIDKIKRSKSLLVVISGPSGVGKDTIIDRLHSNKFDLYHVITATTREKRPGESHGKDYYFIPKKQFLEMIENNEFLEWATVYENYYGVPKTEVKSALADHQIVLIKVDVQGSETIKRIVPEAVFIFLMPASTQDLFERLTLRGSMRDVELKLRLAKAEHEINSLSLFDYFVINEKNNLDVAVAKIEAILTAEICRVKSRDIRF
jgi:guanylate kinase